MSLLVWWQRAQINFRCQRHKWRRWRWWRTGGWKHRSFAKHDGCTPADMLDSWTWLVLRLHGSTRAAVISCSLTWVGYSVRRVSTCGNLRLEFSNICTRWWQQAACNQTNNNNKHHHHHHPHNNNTQDHIYSVLFICRAKPYARVHFGTTSGD